MRTNLTSLGLISLSAVSCPSQHLRGLNTHVHTHTARTWVCVHAHGQLAHTCACSCIHTCAHTLSSAGGPASLDRTPLLRQVRNQCETRGGGLGAPGSGGQASGASRCGLVDTGPTALALSPLTSPPAWPRQEPEGRMMRRRLPCVAEAPWPLWPSRAWPLPWRPTGTSFGGTAVGWCRECGHSQGCGQRCQRLAFQGPVGTRVETQVTCEDLCPVWEARSPGCVGLSVWSTHPPEG